MDFGIQSSLWQIVGRLGLAVLVGSALGINRNLRRKPAGVRTHALVSLGTALVTLITFESTGHNPEATSRVVQGLVTGIGFLGAGVIIHHDAEHRVEGLTTAATVWMTAIFGIACGVGQGGIVLVGLVFALGVLVCGRSVEHAMARWLNRGDNFESAQGDTYHTS
jgi:putative Mg2+ transporter-C (MgtC) family protein